ncbi:hypothetical protein HZQ97_07875 [Elizabethkingia anophelis]|uniref:YobI family P-loop NTPase n=1 Tax=Elizabethkingia TaxID=308865 RepID=UPI0021A2F082|nr:MULTISPECIES: hypothetical protein [unclassified Elizabethkingia]MCT3644062.1 hypothetical protein [Elizabethkingia anophelis]MCT3676945.1 hypothetical protein [Elizabethkingia anophelis]MCT3684380.1 hypothetical protein [Elizabethkingia anophelis]MDX8560026.1 hypothetical protein [Elizabethkingia sp. HX ZCH]MDX8578606.1 hypothetical protein [Elizabethkingia sp. HX YK]
MKRNLFSFFLKSKRTEVEVKKTLVSSLAPKILTKEEDIKNIQPYLDKLKETIETEGISNIALTGGYGSGKSTIIKTFQSQNQQYSFLNISLASFNKKNEEDKADKSLLPSEKKIQKEELERLLEVSILQQIFYHVKPQQIPESRFKRIDNISGWRIFGISVGFVLWVISTTLLLKYNYLDRINPTNWSIKESFDWWSLPIFLISLSGLGILSKLVINLFSNSKINKLNIKGELELGENINKSVFNEHLEEILYFFERTRYNVVIIEDLDRFDSTDIFTKLREINILLNNSMLINREINFVYAVGDDLFGDKKERVKFFEYIIPVIPFINSTNADEQLQTLINESGIDKNIFTNEFISDITTFIDDIDMRLLTNIFHEFVIYRKILNPDFIKKNDELFAMITYKNIDPKDFNDLNKKQGKLYKLINNKNIYIKKLIKDIDDKIELKNIEITKIEDEIITNINELKSIYFQKILSKTPTNALINNNTINIDFDELIENEKLNYNTYNRVHSELYTNGLDFKFSEIENEVNPNYTYKERVKLIEVKLSNKTNLLKSEISKLKAEKSQIQNWELKQIFDKVDVDQYLDHFSNIKLLRNLILNGYINENYNNYISLFHEISITKEDFTFEQNVKGGYISDFNYELSNKIENLIDRIDVRYFEREVILNFDLVDYLGNNYSKYPDKYDSIINLLSNGKEKSIQFIDSYIKVEDRPLEIFFEKLVENWKDFWEFVVEKSVYDRTKIDEYLRLMITYTKPETILNYQSKEFLNEMIETNPQFLSLFKNLNERNYYDKITKLFTGLNTKFNRLDDPNRDTEKLIEYIYNNNHYNININNLLQFTLLFGKNTNENDFMKSNYSTILKSECEPLIKYINSNITTYINNIYLKIENNNLEEEESLIKLLNNDNITEILKIKIIEKVETKISDLTKINELNIKAQLLLDNKVVPKWNNITNYYTDCGELIDESLIEFLNFKNVYSELSKNRLKKEDDKFEKSLIRCNDISDEAYDQILNSTYFNWNTLSFEKLNLEKVKNLLVKKLNTTTDNYELLKEHFPNNHIRLIEKNFSKFIENINDFQTSENDILLLLKSDKITIDNKFNYITNLDENIVNKNKEISKIIGEIILQKKEIIEFSFDTLKLIAVSLLYDDKRIQFTNLHLEKFTNSEITQVLNSFITYNKLFKKGKPTLKKTDYNRILLENLKSKQLIKNFYDDSWSDDKYRVTTNY